MILKIILTLFSIWCSHGGWNNVRMAMETVLVAAHAMGRTLVLPPEHDMYLLSNVRNTHNFNWMVCIC